MPSTVFFSPCEGNTIAIERLDTEIQRLIEQLYRLKIQRNAMTITYSLPPEVLSEILLIVQANCKHDTAHQFSKDYYSELRSWLPITHVAQHWRTVALDCAKLWCKIDTLPAAAIREFMIRSRGYNLSVDLVHSLSHGWWYTCSENLSRDVFAETFRIQRLSVRGSDGIREVLQHITSLPAPKLKELILDASGDEDGDLYLSDDTHLFQGITPQLQILSLNGCNISLHSLLFLADLTTLDISHFPKASPTEWLTIIKRMPCLSELRLRFCFASSQNADAYNPIPQAFGVVHLPQLSELVIQGSCFESELDLLSHITFPSHTAVWFISRFGLLSNPDELAHFPLRSFLRVHSKSRCNTSQMDIRTVRLDGVTGSNNGYDHGPISRRSFELIVHGEVQILLNVCITGFETLQAYDEQQLSELTSLPISSTTSFITNLPLTQDMWRLISDWLPNLQSVSCSSGAIRLFLKALGAQPADFRHSLQDFIPNLGLHFDDCENDHRPVDSIYALFRSLSSIRISQPSGVPIRKAVIHVLRNRVKLGSSLRRVLRNH